jgi:Fe-S-cluster containining protein
MSAFHILDCKTCGDCCQGKIHVFTGEIGSDPKSPHDFLHIMPLKSDKTCTFLSTEKLCTKYEDRNYPITCRYYPYYIDNSGDMFIALSCTRYSRIVEGIIKKDQDLINGIRDIRSEMVVRISKMVREFWTSHLESVKLKLKINFGAL